MGVLNFTRKPMKKIFCIIGILSLFFSCQEEKKIAPKQEKKESKEVEIQSFTLSELSPVALDSVRGWQEFRSLQQALLSLAPSQNQPQKTLSDSLVLYKRLYVRNPNHSVAGARMDKDWRLPQEASDTIYRFTKQGKAEESYFGWRELLLKDVPYTFSLRAKGNLSKENEMMIGVLRERDKKMIFQERFSLDSINQSIENQNVKVFPLDEGWVNFQVEVRPAAEGMYTFMLAHIPERPADDYISVYRMQLLVPQRFKQEIEGASSKIASKTFRIKSSYDGLYFWLFQVQDELSQLWAKDYFPQALNTPQIKSRLRLFQTYVGRLADEVKNNPQLTEKQIREEVFLIRDSFNSVIDCINFSYEDNLPSRMQKTLGEVPKNQQENP